MKIKTLLEIIEPKVRTRYTDKELSYTSSSSKHSDAGEGHFSHVKHSHDPHMVVKTSRNSNTKDDGYWAFVNRIIKDKLWENPYFPRVYVNTTLQNKKTEDAYNTINWTEPKPIWGTCP